MTAPRRDRLQERLKPIEDRYAGGAERPLGSYALLMSVYTTGLAGMIALGRRRGARLPDRFPLADLTLLTMGTYRASRLITKDSVTSFARAPFTKFEEPAGEGEVNERAIGTGLRHAVGEMVSCPFCIAVWLASIGAFGLVVFPRTARLVCSVLTVVAGSDVLQFGHAALQRLEE